MISHWPDDLTENTFSKQIYLGIVLKDKATWLQNALNRTLNIYSVHGKTDAGVQTHQIVLIWQQPTYII